MDRSVDNRGLYMVRCLRMKYWRSGCFGGAAMLKETPVQSEESGTMLGLVKRSSFITALIEYEEIDSTNRVAKELAVQGGAEGTLVLAKRQNGGKGRLGRSFFSPEGGMYMSMILRPTITADRALLITTCAAVAVARAMERVCDVTAGIKWVNDIFVNGKKVCGILAEAGLSSTSANPEYVVLGIGINVKKQSVPEGLKEIVGCLEDNGQTVLKEDLIVAVWEEFGELYRNLSTAVYMEEYKARSILLGKEVTVYAPEGDYTAIVTDIDKEGHLIINKNERREELSFGEISVRL